MSHTDSAWCRSRRQRLLGAALAVALSGAVPLVWGSVETTAAGADAFADAVYHNGRIYTVDDERSWAEAVAIRDGLFVGVGSSAGMLRLAGPKTTRIDLNGAMAMPGLHDAHFHTMAIYSALDCSPPPFKAEDLRAVLTDCRHRQVEGHPWLIVNNLALWEGIATTTNEVVNELFPDTPVMIRDTSGHNLLVNDRALELAGIDRHTPDPEGGRIFRDPQTGKATGLLAEVAAMLLVRQQIPHYPEAALEAAIDTMIDTLFGFGITSIQDAAVIDRDLLSRLRRRDRQEQPMPYTMIHLVWQYPDDETRAELEETLRQRHRFESRHVSTRGVKVLLDGVPVPPAFTHVPLNDDGTVDETNLLVPRDVLLEKLIEWDRAGQQLKMHASAEGSVRVGLNAIEALRNDRGDSGIWHEITHAGDVHEDDVPRFARLRAVAEISPYFWHQGFFSGTDFPTSYRFRALHEAGATITLGSDNVVVPSFNPFPPLEGVVTRKGESVPLATALDFLTRNPAKVMGRLDELGTIEVGKIANLIVLDRNPFEMPAEQIGETQVTLTVLDGEVVYRGP